MYGPTPCKMQACTPSTATWSSRTPPAAPCSDASARPAAPLGVGDLARAVGLHPNSVREQLRRLEEAGLVRVSVAAPSGRGRPGLRFELVPEPEDPYRVLAGVLADQVAALPDAPAVWTAAGERWGRGCRVGGLERVPLPRRPPRPSRSTPSSTSSPTPGSRPSPFCPGRRRGQAPGLPVPAHRTPPPARGVRHPPRFPPGRAPRAWLARGTRHPSSRWSGPTCVSPGSGGCPVPDLDIDARQPPEQRSVSAVCSISKTILRP